MITRRAALLGMVAAATGLTTTTSKAANVARLQAAQISIDETQRSLAGSYAGWPSDVLRQIVEELDFVRFQAHACLRRDHMQVWYYREQGANRAKLAYAESVAELRFERHVRPADSRWNEQGRPMLRELQARGEQAHFPAYTLDDGEAYRDYIERRG
jgi:hypothetical protein